MNMHRSDLKVGPVVRYTGTGEAPGEGFSEEVPFKLQ